MRGGILLIGPLLWEDGENGTRAEWRAVRLDVESALPVQVPIRYGRKSNSRGNTFTMTFKPGEEPAAAQAVLVPCIGAIEAIDNLVAEAHPLWKVEAPRAPQNLLHSSWGCVGALFRHETMAEKLARDWTAYFQQIKAQGVSVVSDDGLLEIAWPCAPEGNPADFDVILATGTKPEAEPPTAYAVADAWVSQRSGHEKYFFNNVKHGIRTPEDSEIWRSIEAHAPSWLGAEEYQEAIEILRAEAASHDAS